MNTALYITSFVFGTTCIDIVKVLKITKAKNIKKRLYLYVTGWREKMQGRTWA